MPSLLRVAGSCATSGKVRLAERSGLLAPAVGMVRWGEAQCPLWGGGRALHHLREGMPRHVHRLPAYSLLKKPSTQGCCAHLVSSLCAMSNGEGRGLPLSAWIGRQDVWLIVPHGKLAGTNCPKMNCQAEAAGEEWRGEDWWGRDDPVGSAGIWRPG